MRVLETLGELNLFGKNKGSERGQIPRGNDVSPDVTSKKNY